MSNPKTLLVLVSMAMVAGPLAMAGEDPREERHELMESVGKAAKPVGEMLKGDREFDAAVLMTSLGTWEEVSAVFGDLFPEGTETGMGTEAAPAIWEDRAGFEEALGMWRERVLAASEAAPQTLDEAKPVVGPVFNACKNCHDNYRIDD